ncbi:glycosyltransferase family 9 protein [Abditibacterium utsteinense]|nr:glycosyltransferase family 9 protein [Abditibacterium utsteinense]
MSSSFAMNAAPPLSPPFPSQIAGYRNDCRHFLGEKPCKFKCEGGCQHFEAFGTRILVIKLGATGDVLRTTPILRALKAKYPASHITWIVEPISAPLLKANPFIDRVLTPDFETLSRLHVETFDLMLCLDKVEAATSLAMLCRAREKRGFGLTDLGTLTILNPEAEFALRMGVSDRLKFYENEKAYQQIVFEAVGLPYQGEKYVLELERDAHTWAKAFFAAHELHSPIVGLNTGAGSGFAGKAWRVEKWAALARRAQHELGAKVLLLGGPQERERNAEIAARAADAVIDSGTSNTLPQFIALVDGCDAVVTGDTTGMHVAIAREIPTVALFGSTCAPEIDLYGRGEKIVASVDCAPCYLKKCPIGEICLDDIKFEDVFAALQRQLEL